jgi:hypothetical protein
MKFRRNILSPFAVSKVKPITSRKQAAKYNLASCWFLFGLFSSATSQDIALLVTAVRTSDPIITAGYPLLALSV